MKKIVFFLSVLLACNFQSCVEDTPFLPELVQLYINEVLSNGNPDWIEIFNPNDFDVELEGYSLMDSKTDYTIPAGIIIPAESFLVFECDDLGSGLHTNFKLSADGEAVWLMDPQNRLVDSVNVPGAVDSYSYSRIYDGSPDFDFLNPTKGNSNSKASITILYINEFLASNSLCCQDSFGDYDDWIEIYNGGSTDVDIGGYYITDDLNDSFKCQIPTSSPLKTTIKAGGFLILWADDEVSQGVLHLPFSLSKSGEDIALFNTKKSLVDNISFTDQSADVSYGRKPDGAANWQFFSTPSPGSSNN